MLTCNSIIDYFLSKSTISPTGHQNPFLPASGRSPKPFAESPAAVTSPFCAYCSICRKSRKQGIAHNGNTLFFVFYTPAFM